MRRSARWIRLWRFAPIRPRRLPGPWDHSHLPVGRSRPRPAPAQLGRREYENLSLPWFMLQTKGLERQGQLGSSRLRASRRRRGRTKPADRQTASRGETNGALSRRTLEGMSHPLSSFCREMILANDDSKSVQQGRLVWMSFVWVRRKPSCLKRTLALLSHPLSSFHKAILSRSPGAGQGGRC